MQMGNRTDGVPPLKLLNAQHVTHFDKNGVSLSRMKRIMKVIRYFGEVRGVWKIGHGSNIWNGETVTKLWAGIWDDVKPYLFTKTVKSTCVSYHKSRTGQLAWRTCYDKFKRTGLFDSR
jgi:hypothetical protein